MLIEVKNSVLVTFLSDRVEENGVEVTIDPHFYLPDGSLDLEKIANICVDSYYNSLRMQDTPPSIDNLLIIDRGRNCFSLYLIELKSVRKLGQLSKDNIKAKFNTTINDFMSTRFRNIFNKNGAKVADINLWLICNRFNYIGSGMSDQDYEKRIKSTLIEQLLLIPPFRFAGRIATIQSLPSSTCVY